LILRKIFSFLFILTMALSFSYSQVIPTGKLVGTVTDNEGLALPGATVTIKSPSLILPQMASVTNERGFYRFTGLASGNYQVKVEMTGMKTLIREGIVIRAGGTTTLNVILEPSPIEETVTVVGKAPTVDLQSTKTGTTFDKTLIANLPLPRYLSNIYNATPGMFDRTSHGSDARSNKFLVDGVMHQDPVTGDPIMEVGFESIEEVIVDTGGHSAEHGQVKGAVVQVLTKSGGNHFSGEVNLFLRNKSLQDDNTKGTPFEGEFVGFDHQYLSGLSLGGPVKNDKIWFFSSFNLDKKEFYVQGFPYDQEENEPIHQDIYSPYLKLTWQIGPNDKLIGSGYWRGYYDDQRDAAWWREKDTAWDEDRGGWLFTLQWSRVFSANFLLNVKGAYYDFHQDLLSKTEEAPWWNYATGVGILERNYGSDWWLERERFQVNQDASYFLDDWFGTHEFKAGFGFEYAWHTQDSFYYQDPRFEGMFEPGFKAVDIEHLDGFPLWVWVGEEIKKRASLIQTGVFVQDTWSPSSNFTFNLGLRYDFTRHWYPPQEKKYTGEIVNSESVVTMAVHRISPRLGISFDPIGDGKTVLKAHYGRYYSPVIMTNFWWGNPAMRRSYWVRLTPDWQESYRAWYSDPTAVEVDSDIGPSHGDEITFGVEREIIADLSFSVTFIAKWEKNLVDDVDQAHIDIDYFKETGELKWSGYTPIQGTDPMTGNPVTFYEMNPDFGAQEWLVMNIPGTVRKYRGLELKLTKRMSNNWAMQASYVWSKGEGLLNTSRGQSTGESGYYDNPNVHINAFGLLDFQRQHQVDVQVTYSAPLGFQLSAYYQFGSGMPYTRMIRSEEAGLGMLYQGYVTILAEPRGSSKLSDQHILDMRVEKSFKLGPGEFSVLGDVFNAFNSNEVTDIGNLTNVNWGTPYSIMGPRYVQLAVRYRF
jgi:outer membrane receptor protein involved in Fe transport